MPFVNYGESKLNKISREITKRSNTGLYSSPLGYSSTLARLANFNYKPLLILRIHPPCTPRAVQEWCLFDYLAYFLTDIFPEKAFSDWFELEYKDESKYDENDTWKVKLNGMYFFDSYLEAFKYGMRYGLGLLHYDTRENQFQVVSGMDVYNVKEDKFHHPIQFQVIEKKGSGNVIEMPTTLQKEFTYWIRKDEKGFPKGISYLQRIWDELYYLKWMRYAMAESSAAMGSGFLTIGLENPSPEDLTNAQNEAVGLSQRKGLVHSTSLIKSENIKYHVVDMSPTITIFMQEMLKSVSTYTGLPYAFVSGLNQGVYTGADQNIGNLYDAYKRLQKEAEKSLRPILHRLLDVDMSEIVIKWNNKQRLTELEEENLKITKLKRQMMELNLERAVKGEEGIQIPQDNIIQNIIQNKQKGSE